MKINYIANDGKVFNNREDALKYEAEQQTKESKSRLRKDEIMEIVNENNKKIDELKRQIGKILDANDELLEEYKNLLNPEQQKLCDEMNKLIEVLFSD